MMTFVRQIKERLLQSTTQTFIGTLHEEGSFSNHMEVSPKKEHYHLLIRYTECHPYFRTFCKLYESVFDNYSPGRYRLSNPWCESLELMVYLC